ncbi:MAG: hypothetical protein ACFFG0_30865 [Candidatus Thorarchaeota archaeon]
MPVCSHCGGKIRIKDMYCPICGLNRKRGKGKITSTSKFYKNTEKNNVLRSSDDILLEIPDKIKKNKIWKYYDLETLTQEKVDSELMRLHGEIEGLESTLIFMEAHEPGHPDKMKFYEDRIKLTAQLDTIYDFLSIVEHERINDFIRNTDFEIKYGRLPKWRIEELKRKEASKYYNLKHRNT